MCDRRCLNTACNVFYGSSSSFFGAAAPLLMKQIGFTRGSATDASSPRGAWIVAAASGPGRPRRSSSRARGVNEARAAAVVEAEVGRLSEPRAVGRRTTPTRSSSWPRGSLRGSPTPLVSPEAPPREPCPAEAVQRHLRRPRDRGGGAARTYITKRTYTNAPLQRELAAKRRPTARRGAARPGQVTALRYAVVQRPRILRKQAAPAARLAETAREAPAGGERRKRTRRPRARS